MKTPLRYAALLVCLSSSLLAGEKEMPNSKIDPVRRSTGGVTPLMRTTSMAALWFVAAGPVLAVEPSSEPDCEDSVSSTANVVPTLDSPLYHETKTSLNWWIVESESGALEDTTDGEIGPDDLVRIEHTANCASDHQGEHLMEFCEAVRDGENLRLDLSGGMPAYTGGLNVTIDPDLKFRCSFSAAYPAPTTALRWKITKKELRLRSRDFTPGHRLFGWISVNFEESDASGGQPRTYKIEGYIKPVIQHKQQGGAASRNEAEHGDEVNPVKKAPDL